MKETFGRHFKNICVFYGSSHRNGKVFVKAANNIGQVLANRKINLVYEGGSFGLMGSIADTIYAKGSEVLRIILVH